MLYITTKIYMFLTSMYIYIPRSRKLETNDIRNPIKYNNNLHQKEIGTNKIKENRIYKTN